MGSLETLKLVYFMLGVILATSIYLNLIAFGMENGEELEEMPSMYTDEEISSLQEVEVPLLAVNSYGNAGEVGHATINGISGSSNVFLMTEPMVSENAQYSSSIASMVAHDIAEEGSMDFMVRYHINSNRLSGESAGAAKTLGMLSLLKNKTLREDTVITGAVARNGWINHVSGIPEKIKAANHEGYDRVLIPRGQGGIDFRARVMMTRESDSNVIEGSKERYGVEVIEVSDIEEAADYILE